MAIHNETTKGNEFHLGTHIIAEFFGCSNLEDKPLIQEGLKEAASRCGATIIHTKFHEFSPHGLTGYLLLAESHISIHTWPEYHYAAVDIFTCGNLRPEEGLKHLENILKASKVKTKKILRGRECGPSLENPEV